MNCGKTCAECKETKPLSEFIPFSIRKKGSDKVYHYRQKHCRTCNRKKCREYHKKNKETVSAKRKKVRAENPEKFRERKLAYRKANPEKVREQRRAYLNANPKQREKAAAKTRAWIEANRERHNETLLKCQKKRYKQDAVFRLASKYRANYRHALREKGFVKISSSESVLGMSFVNWKVYMQKLLEKEISLGRLKEGTKLKDTHTDHIVPISFAKTLEEVEALNHYSNLRPALPETNIRKSNKLDLSLVCKENRIRYKDIISRQ
tara:strand:+ start:37 stop:828 length:792 start_codon:yes stop_codon:yes gene_type:complete